MVVSDVVFSVDGHLIFSGRNDTISQWEIPDEVLTAAGGDGPAEELKNEAGHSRSKQKNIQVLLHSEIPSGQRRHKAMNSEHIDRSRMQVTHSAFFGRGESESETPSSSRLHGVTTFFNRIRSSSDKKGKQKQHQPKRKAPKVVDVPFGDSDKQHMCVLRNSIEFVRYNRVLRQGDAVGVDDGKRPYVLFFCLSWSQKKEKKPDTPPPVYDDELEDDESEVDIPIPTSRVHLPHQEDIALKSMTGQPQPEAGPSRLAAIEEHPGVESP